MENLNDAYKKLMVITMRRLKTVDEVRVKFVNCIFLYSL